jgi:hypothetical protein
MSTNALQYGAAAAAFDYAGGGSVAESPSSMTGPTLPAPMPVEWASVPARRASHVQHATAGSEEQAKRRYYSAAKKSEHRTARHLRNAILAMAAAMVESGEVFGLQDPSAEIARRLRTSEAIVDATVMCNSHAQERARKAQIAALRRDLKETEAIATECYEDTMSEYEEEFES